MLQINIHCHNRISELEKLFISLAAQSIHFKPKLNIIIDPTPSGPSEQLQNLIFIYKEKLNQKYEVRIYRFSENIGLASAIINGLRNSISIQCPTVVLEDDLVLLDDFVIQNIHEIYKDGFEGHINLWQPSGFYSADSICFGNHMWCWGWAVDHKTLVKFLDTRNFSLNFMHLIRLASWGFDFINHLVVNFKKEKQTWAIFYYIFIFTQCCAIYNFPRAKTAEVSVSGTNRRTSKLRKVGNKVNDFFLEMFLKKPLHPNIRYKLTFSLNLLLPFRFLRSLTQILLYRRRLCRFAMEVKPHQLVELN